MFLFLFKISKTVCKGKFLTSNNFCFFYLETILNNSYDTSCSGHQTPVTPLVPTAHASSGLPTISNQSRLSALMIVVIAVSGVTAVIIGVAVSCYIWKKRRNRRFLGFCFSQTRFKGLKICFPRLDFSVKIMIDPLGD